MNESSISIVKTNPNQGYPKGPKGKTLKKELSRGLFRDPERIIAKEKKLGNFFGFLYGLSFDFICKEKL